MPSVSWQKSKDMIRDLKSTCPDGVVIETPWDPEWMWCEASRMRQAEIHRDYVRLHLGLVDLLERAA
jgi:hypothetical protein